MNIFFIVSLFCAIAYGFIKPYSDGLIDTSLWVGKIMVKINSDSSITANDIHAMKQNQKSLLLGWPSLIIIMPISFTIIALTTGLYDSWKTGLIAFVIISFNVLFTKRLLAKPIRYYLRFFMNRMLDRAEYYLKRNDEIRSMVCKAYLDELFNLAEIYGEANITPPNSHQLKTVPFGDKYYWLIYVNNELGYK